MIDTVKIYAPVNKAIYDVIENNSIHKQAIDKSTGEILYNIINGHLEGSFDSRLSVRCVCASVFNLGVIADYCIVIEGSLHKFIYGYNSHNGFYDIFLICQVLIGLVEETYNIKLPDFEQWFLQRADIAICFDLENQNNVLNYINNLKKCSFPRRQVRFYKNESLYSAGTYTTLKIYNKLKEFRKHDLIKFKNTDFDVDNYMLNINGYIRFEVEIKKRKLLEFYKEKLLNDKHIKIIYVCYEDLKKIWSEEFMKLLKISNSELNIVNDREKIKYILDKNFSAVRARNLYNFYLTSLVEGIEYMKNQYSSSTYYRNISDLSKFNINLGQSYNVTISNKIIDFNPFLYKEVV